MLKIEIESRMKRLLSTDQLGERLPVWVISYNRFDSPTLTRIGGWRYVDNVHVVVRESQVAKYREVHPRLNFHPLPDDRINSCGAARWGAYDLAREMGHKRAVMLDDDLLQFRYLYESAFVRGPNAGSPCSRVADSADIDRWGGVSYLEEATVAYMGATASAVFDEQPNAVIGTAIKRLRSFDNRNHQTMYYLNGGSTPRQWTVWELERLEEHGIRLNLEHFGVVGEDVGFLATLFQAGLDAFTMPSFAYEHWVEAVNEKKSLIRSADTTALLSEYEFMCLQKYDMGPHYLRSCPSRGDEYEWGEVDWRRLAKFRGSRMERFLWGPDQSRKDILEEIM